MSSNRRYSIAVIAGDGIGKEVMPEGLRVLGDYAGGLGRAVDALIARLSGEGLPAPAGAAPSDQGSSGLPDWVVVAGALLPVVLYLIFRTNFKLFIRYRILHLLYYLPC